MREKKNTLSNESIPPQTFHDKVIITSPRNPFFTNIRYHKSNPTPQFLPPNSYTAHTYIHNKIPSSKPVRTSTYIHTDKTGSGGHGGKIPSPHHHHHHHHQGTRMDLHTTKKMVPSPYIFVRAQMIRTVGCFADSAIRVRN